MIKKIIIAIFIAVLYLLNNAPVLAQQTIFNVPSAEVSPKGKIFLQPEFQFRPWNPGRFILNTDYFTAGIGHNTELDMTLGNVTAPSTNNIVLGTGFKSAIPIFSKKFPKREFKAIIGTEVLTSLQGDGVGNCSYAELSGRLPKIKTRLTAGISVGTKQTFGKNAVSFVGGYEQPVTKNFSLQGDWYSGTHYDGFFIPGFAYAFPKDITLYAGYQIPNNSQCGKSGFVVELAKIF